MSKYISNYTLAVNKIRIELILNIAKFSIKN